MASAAAWIEVEASCFSLKIDMTAFRKGVREP
jgi:hypothetical protein